MKNKSDHTEIRLRNKSSDLASKMKQGLIRSKDKVQEFTDDTHYSPEEYAEEKIVYTSEDAVHGTTRNVKDTAKKGYGTSKRLARNIKRNKNTADNSDNIYK